MRVIMGEVLDVLSDQGDGTHEGISRWLILGGG